MNERRVPEISIIVPVFNAARFLHASLSSVLDHTLADVEVICIDDGSTDDSTAVLDQMTAMDKRISVIRLGINSGASTARNAGIERAQGEYVFFLDADDSVPRGALDTLLSAARTSSSALTIGKLYWSRSEAEANEAAALPQSNRGGIVVTNVHESTWLQSVSGSHCCNLHSRQMLEQNLIRYDTDLTYGEDQLFQARTFVAAGKVAIIDDIVYVYHHYRSQSVTRRPPGLKNLLDDIEFHRRIARLFSDNELRDAGLRFLRAWSYSIREYWLQMPANVTREEADCFFSAFRLMTEEFGITPWADSTPTHHRHLLGLIMEGQDEQALTFLASEEARLGLPAGPRLQENR